MTRADNRRLLACVRPMLLSRGAYTREMLYAYTALADVGLVDLRLDGNGLHVAATERGKALAATLEAGAA